MKLKAFITAALILAPALAIAHAPRIGEHGGPQADAGGFHVEAVAKEKTLDVYLQDHALKPVASGGFKGVAIFKDANGKPVRIPLEPAGDNKLSGAASEPLPAELEGAVQLTTQTGGSVQGKFGGHGMDHDQMSGHER